MFTELLRPSSSDKNNESAANEAGQKTVRHPTQSAPTVLKDQPAELPTQFFLTALEQSIDDTGWTLLSTFGSYLNKLQPDFDSRLFGYKKLSDLVRAKTDLFVFEKRNIPETNNTVMYLRAKL